MKPLLIIKVGTTDPDMAARWGDFEDWFTMRLTPSPTPIEIVCPVTEDMLPEADAVGGVIITGSHDMVTDKKPWSERTAVWISRVVAARVPVLGVCYGHQLLAHAMGGIVGDNPNGKEVGTVSVRLNEQGQLNRLFHGLPETFDAHACHTQSVLELPPGAALLASSAMDAHTAFVIGDNAWGVQFHPEFDMPVMRSYLQRMADDLKAQGSDVDRLNADVRETPHSEGLLKRFQRLCG